MRGKKTPKDVGFFQLLFLELLDPVNVPHVPTKDGAVEVILAIGTQLASNLDRVI